MGHWTEDEARAFGLVKDKNGNWHQTSKNAASRPSVDTSPLPQPQHPVRRVEATAPQEGATEGAYEICVVSYRRRAADPDNICPKVWIDLLVEQGWLPDDSSRFVQRVTKEVVLIRESEIETTEIEIWKLIP